MNPIDFLPGGLDLGQGRQQVSTLYFGVDDGPVFGGPGHECGRPDEVVDFAIVKILHDANDGHLASV